MELRYICFDQQDNTRVYKFDGVEKGQAIVQFVVTADLALFLKHHISIQEGPARCVPRKLSTESLDGKMLAAP